MQFKKKQAVKMLVRRVQATHGCCENRGIRSLSSLTQTTVLRGAFKEDPATKKEFMDNVKLQQFMLVIETFNFIICR